MSRAEIHHTLGLLALDGVILSSLAGPMDILRVAQKLAQVRDPATPLRLDTFLVGARAREKVATATGFDVGPVVSADRPLDLLLVPGFMHSSAENLVERLPDYAAEIATIRAAAERGTPIAASCCGTFLLAEAGLLDGRTATTSWWLHAMFRKRFPAVKVEIDKMVVEDGPVTTTGASTAVLNFILQWLAKKTDPALAQHTGRMMLIDPDRQSQAPYISLALTERPRHSLSEKAEHFLQKQLHGELSIAELAAHCDTSERSLLRHFRQHYGASPLAHIQHLRVERAKALLETTLLSFDEIVERCGYSDASSFRKLFKRATSLTPADYRERFRLRAA